MGRLTIAFVIASSPSPGTRSGCYGRGRFIARAVGALRHDVVVVVVVAHYMSLLARLNNEFPN